MIFISTSALAQGRETDSVNAHYLAKSFSSPADSPAFRRRPIVAEDMLIHPVSHRNDFARSQIWAMEAEECRALKKRDTAALKKIWYRDFSQDAPPGELVVEKNPLPYYVWLSRKVDNVQIVGDFAYTNGVECVQLLNPFRKLEPAFERKYNHVWARKNGSWILISKFAGK